MSLRTQTEAMIETCGKVLETVAKGKDGADNRNADYETVQIARKIIEKARAAYPNDEVLAEVKLDGNFVSWTSLLAAMRVVHSTLPKEGV